MSWNVSLGLWLGASRFAGTGPKVVIWSDMSCHVSPMPYSPFHNVPKKFACLWLEAARYHKMSLQYHPDKVGGGEAATKKFNEIKNARERLGSSSCDNRAQQQAKGLKLWRGNGITMVRYNGQKQVSIICVIIHCVLLVSIVFIDLRIYALFAANHRWKH